MGCAYGGGQWKPAYTLEGVCAAARLPPLLPDEVKRRLEHEKTFTSEADKLYRSFFDGITRFATRLNFQGLAWGHEEVQQLVDVLPRFAVLTALDLSKNKVDAAGAEPVAKYVKGNAVC